MKRATFSILLVCLMSFFATTAHGQATGTIVGTVADDSGAVIPGAAVTVTNKGTETARTLATNAEGLYSAPALPSGDYEVRVERQGFRTVVRQAQVQTGGTTTVNLSLSPGATKEVVTVEAASAQINYDSNTVQGVIQRETIQDIPINGRSFLQLATMQPGVTISTGSTSTYNSLVSVTTLGQAKAAMTVDGGNINNEVLGAWNSVAQNFSQEIVQEFQLSSVNFDPSTGNSIGAGINIVTRSGGNDFHGGAYFFYRDHNMAAFPGLKRPCDPSSAGARNSSLCKNPADADKVNHPFFARRNPGFTVSGPILKNKLFFFFNTENYNQTQANVVQMDLASLSGLNTINQSPYNALWPSIRLDYVVSPKNTMFTRYTHDGNSGTGGSGEYSSYTVNYNWSDQFALGLTSTLTPNLVNDARAIYHYFKEDTALVPASACQYPCIGGGFPSISSMVGSGTFIAGQYNGAPQVHTARNYQFIESLNWQKGTHRLRFAVNWEHANTYYYGVNTCNQVCMSVYSPESVAGLATAAQLAQYFPNLPGKITTNADLLNLPVSNTAAAYYSGVGIGNGQQPGPYNFDKNRQNDKPLVYFTDTWKVKPNLTVSAGIRWEMETGLYNSDMPRPQFLAPILGANNLNAPQAAKDGFGPTLGFAWSPGKSGKTVIRGGGGIFYDSMQLYQRWRDAGLAGPAGNARLVLATSILTNEFPGIFNISTNSPLPVGASLPLSQLTNMTLGQFLQIYNNQIGALTQRFTPTPPTSGPYTVSGIDLAKQGLEIYPGDFKLARSYQTSIGMQRDLGHNMVLTVDWARRLATHSYIGEQDLNRYNRYIGGVNTPVIPKCTGSPLAYTVGQQCSSGPITIWSDKGRSAYQGLLVHLDKRMSHNYQMTVSYAFQNQKEVTVVNLDNYFAGFGPNLARNNLTVAGVVKLPWAFSLSLNSSFITRNPVNPTVGGVDLTGSGLTTLPIACGGPCGLSGVTGLSYGCFNTGCSQSDLTAAVASFNTNYSTVSTGKKSATGATIPQLILPANYQLGQDIVNQDIRLTKTFTLKERYKFQAFVEAFNVLNIANLAGFSYALNTVNPNPAAQSFSFGQPTARAGGTFGSAGPRALQVGGRISF